MKKMLCFILIGFAVSVNAQRPVKATIKLPGLNCEECEQIIENKLWKAVDGITAIDVKWKRKSVMLTYIPDRIDIENIRIIIADLGFDADDEKADTFAMKKLPACCKKVVVPEKPKNPVALTPVQAPVPATPVKTKDTIAVKKPIPLKPVVKKPTTPVKKKN